MTRSVSRISYNIAYRSDGCSFHDHCLTCPLPACRYDFSGGEMRSIRNMLAFGLDVESTGDSIAVVAKRHHIATRTGYRYWRYFCLARRIEHERGVVS